MLFNDILIHLFGINYCLQITNNMLLDDKYIFNRFQEKIFYNSCSISKTIADNKVSKKILESVLPKQQLFAQYLITTEEPELFYFDLNSNDYTVFHVNHKVEEMYIPKWCESFNKLTLTKDKLQKAIKDDLENFTKILKLHSATIVDNELQQDDKKVMLSSLNDKLKSFIRDIKNANLDNLQKIKEDIDLYKTLELDFKKSQIKQSNLMKYFNILYPENSFSSPRTLMVALRKIDNDFFKNEKIKSGSDGKKYFKILSI